ncbi:PEP-CTERM sorting domain-containing protein [Rubritalea spongiae]|uniref:PEP-CTERM sorting domain-containing protein n=1 Tax=Rubritalea spongiae TaxID=430797 RepID=A0ABW5E5I3_9BACT
MKYTYLALCSSLLIAGGANAAVILNNSFESSFTEWDVVSTSPNLNTNDVSLGGATYNGVNTAAGGSALLSNRAFANLNGGGQSVTLTAFVYQDGATSNTDAKEIISATDYEFTMAIGNKNGGSGFTDNGNISLVLGYLATANDMSSFTSFASLSKTAAELKSEITENTWADYTVNGTVLETDDAFGKQLAVQFTTSRSNSGVSGNNQTSFDYARVAAVPEPSTSAMLGLLGLGALMRRRR